MRARRGTHVQSYQALTLWVARFGIRKWTLSTFLLRTLKLVEAPYSLGLYYTPRFVVVAILEIQQNSPLGFEP